MPNKTNPYAGLGYAGMPESVQPYKPTGPTAATLGEGQSTMGAAEWAQRGGVGNTAMESISGFAGAMGETRKRDAIFKAATELVAKGKEGARMAIEEAIAKDPEIESWLPNPDVYIIDNPQTGMPDPGTVVDYYKAFQEQRQKFTEFKARMKLETTKQEATTARAEKQMAARTKLEEMKNARAQAQLRLDGFKAQIASKNVTSNILDDIIDNAKAMADDLEDVMADYVTDQQRNAIFAESKYDEKHDPEIIRMKREIENTKKAQLAADAKHRQLANLPEAKTTTETQIETPKKSKYRNLSVE